MMRKKFIAFVLAVSVALASFCSALIVFGNDIAWNYDETGKTLYITGSGAMDDYNASADTPWSSCLVSVKTVIIEEGVTSVGNNAFSGAALLDCVQLADSVSKIGAFSFASCPALMTLTLGNGIKSIADASFAYNGVNEKSGFTVTVEPGSFALHYAFKNNINFVCEDVKSGILHIHLEKGMWAYFPYTCRYTGSYRFYSVSKHDTLGYIYSSAKAQLAYNDDRASSYDSAQGSTDFGITSSLTKGERYYLAVRIFNPSLTADFDVYFEPVEYTVSGTVYAMNSPQGEPSDIVLNTATINGTATENGTFTRTVNGGFETVEIACDGVTLTHTFSVDDGDTIAVSMMMCDRNNDGIVNAKDYALMRQSNAPYISLFENFMNYRY